MSAPDQWSLLPPGRDSQRSAKKFLIPGGWPMIAFLFVGLALFVALHVILPAPRDASMEMGTSAAIAIAGALGVARAWSTRKSSPPNVIAMALIVSYAVLCFGLGILRPHQVIPWFLNPAMVAVDLLLIEAVWRLATTRRST